QPTERHTLCRLRSHGKLFSSLVFPRSCAEAYRWPSEPPDTESCRTHQPYSGHGARCQGEELEDTCVVERTLIQRPGQSTNPYSISGLRKWLVAVQFGILAPVPVTPLDGAGTTVLPSDDLHHA